MSLITGDLNETEQRSSNIFDSMYSSSQQDDEDSNEIKTYLFEKIEPQTTNPLEYWKNNQFRFKSLSLMAKDFLAIPATSVPIECVFSQSSDLISKKRNRLLPETVRVIMCLSHWKNKN
jgi:hypothetical protein